MIYKTEQFLCDQTGAQIRVMTPVKELEETKFIGSAQIDTGNGQGFPIQFEINDVKTVTEAFTKFRECAENEIKKLEKEMSEANNIIDVKGNPIGASKGKKEPLIFPGL